MRAFTFTSTKDKSAATKFLGDNPAAKLLAGGTNLLDLMKEQVEQPDQLIDINGLQLAGIKMISAGLDNEILSIGGLAKNSATANHPLVRLHFPLLSQAILAGASVQIRNMASNAGNLLQRTRCSYFYDVAMPCNKRTPGTGCGAFEGINRMHAIFGWSEKCIAVYPSDMSVALAALEAVVTIQQADGQVRKIPFADFHRLPGDTPEKDTNLDHGELITTIEISKNNFAANSSYVKVRDRASYAFALLSVAAALEMDAENRIVKARIAMGGVAHKPWRCIEAEKILTGKEANDENFRQAAEAAMKHAKPLEHNKFKVGLGKNTILLALQKAKNGNRSYIN